MATRFVLFHVCYKKFEIISNQRKPYGFGQKTVFNCANKYEILLLQTSRKHNRKKPPK